MYLACDNKTDRCWPTPRYYQIGPRSTAAPRTFQRGTRRAEKLPAIAYSGIDTCSVQRFSWCFPKVIEGDFARASQLRSVFDGPSDHSLSPHHCSSQRLLDRIVPGQLVYQSKKDTAFPTSNTLTYYNRPLYSFGEKTHDNDRIGKLPAFDSVTVTHFVSAKLIEIAYKRVAHTTIPESRT